MSKAIPDSPTPDQPKRTRNPAEVRKVLGYVDGVLGSAGRSIDDAESREILRRQAAGEIIGDEARALFDKLDGRSDAVAVTKRKPTPEEVDYKMALADGAMGAAGHHVSDPEARAILRRQAAEEITGDEARRLLIKNAKGKARVKHQ